jgi:hypothetical protein
MSAQGSDVSERGWMASWDGSHDVELLITRGETQRARIAIYREHVELDRFTHKILDRQYEWSILTAAGGSWEHRDLGRRAPGDEWIDVRLTLIATPELLQPVTRAIQLGYRRVKGHDGIVTEVRDRFSRMEDEEASP